MLPLIDDFALPLCERSGDVANRNIVVILSGSTYGYIRRYNVPAFSEAGIESKTFGLCFRMKLDLVELTSPNN